MNGPDLDAPNLISVLAHHSQRLKRWPCYGAVCRRPSTVQRSHLKPHDQSKPNFMWIILRKGERNLYKWSGHMTKMAAMAINRKKTLKIFSRTGRPMILKLGMKHQGEALYKVCINHDTRMTLTYFTARST